MNSFLITKKDARSYEEKISASPEATKRSKRYAITVFQKFCLARYSKTSEEVIKEIKKIKEEENEKYEDALYGLLQEWINWNSERGIGNYTIRTQFSNLRKFLFHNGFVQMSRASKNI